MADVLDFRNGINTLFEATAGSGYTAAFRNTRLAAGAQC